MKRVEVTWIDIRSEAGWLTQNQLDNFTTKKTPVKQLGYLYEQDEEQIVLLDSYFEDKELYGGAHTIPKGVIIEIKEI
jgi:hypothetical protein